MSDETLEISRKKLFDILSKAFSSLTNEGVVLMKTNDREAYVKNLEVIIDGLNHDILVNSAREPPVFDDKKASKIEVDWS